MREVSEGVRSRCRERSWKTPSFTYGCCHGGKKRSRKGSGRALVEMMLSVPEDKVVLARPVFLLFVRSLTVYENESCSGNVAKYRPSCPCGSAVTASLCRPRTLDPLHHRSLWKVSLPAAHLAMRILYPTRNIFPRRPQSICDFVSFFFPHRPSVNPMRVAAFVYAHNL